MATHWRGTAVIALMTTLGLCAARESLAAPRGYRLNVWWENDLMARKGDRYYTNGLRLSLLVPARTANLQPSGWRGGVDSLARVLIPAPQGARAIQWGVALGQNMYTPSDIRSTELLEDDRPYAGWLYAGALLNLYDTTRLHSFELDLGLIGPEAFGEDVQKGIHHIFGYRQPKGWDNQLKLEPAGLLRYTFVRRFHFLQAKCKNVRFLDLVPHAGAALGNVFVLGRLGAITRFGWNVPDSFPLQAGDNIPSIVTPLRTEDTLPHTPTDLGCRACWRRVSSYVFGGVEGRLVGHNIFLDGNTCKSSHSVSKQPAVVDLEVGTAIELPYVSLQYRYVFRTEEFREQPQGHRFGSVTLSIAF